MKDVNYYMSLSYKMEIYKDLDGYAVSFPSLQGCLSCGKTIEEAVHNAEEAKKCWFEACLQDGIEIPEPIEGKYSGQFKLRIPKSLHKRLAEKAKEEGVSMNAYCNSILSKYCV